MRPDARVQAAAECLDRVLAGEAAEKVLTAWARGARYAGSKDRAVVRDHVYDVLRQKRLCAHLGGGETGRALMIGLIRAHGEAPEAFFTGERHAPAVLGAAERAEPMPPPEAGFAELPDWLLPGLEARYGAALAPQLAALRHRAPVFLRVNGRKATREAAIAQLAEDAIVVRPSASSEMALWVEEGARGVARSRALKAGMVELQDLSSQSAMESIPLCKGMKVLDYCAGGGGKTLALAGRVEAEFFAHDINPARMRDLPPRAARAGVAVRRVDTPDLARWAPYDLVLCDVPCSGSGTWRRDPDAKWRFTPERLEALTKEQDRILDAAAPMVAPAGMLAYATCSLLPDENEARITRFCARHPGWHVAFSHQFLLGEAGDGFFVAHLRRDVES
ncbi:RsmB/NOP family class I SAM-dependent RNA methyltransferase [Aquicoccus porphyridii]|uniref:RsmB/NOP family class I SAM-dependent RNA methyltransferase n=1 Tax=Aquicoccus porphyridii TaxID=1852029 RepID=UPI00273E16DC|nr:RsmB/NOP family class I SAM-dependent RNA methyltransferase [Aquicoccus porphyridii]